MKKRGTGYHLFFNLLLSIRGIIRIVCSIAQILFGGGALIIIFFDSHNNVVLIVFGIVCFVAATLGKWLYDELLHKLCPDDKTIIL